MADIVETPTVTAEDLGDNAPTQEAEFKEVPKAVSNTLALPRPISLKDLIHHWNPMGIRVVVDLPFIGDDRSFLFMIRPQPYIPWLPLNAYTPNALNWMRFYDNMRPVIHDVGTDDGTSYALPPGISIFQHSPPPLFSELSAAYRKWRGSIKYRLRCVTNFTASGYMITSMFRRVQRSLGAKNFFTTATRMFRNDTSFNQGMYNAWLTSDVSMYRHTQFVVPYEYIEPWRDHARMAFNASYIMTPANACTNLNLENLVGVGIRGAVAASDTENQIVFELEYAAGDDFELAVPFPPSESWTWGMQVDKTDIATDSQRLAYEGLVIPTNEWTTDGNSTLVYVPPASRMNPEYDWSASQARHLPNETPVVRKERSLSSPKQRRKVASNPDLTRVCEDGVVDELQARFARMRKEKAERW